MINLLPPEQKEELKEEENLKIVLILGIVILAFLISLTLILLSIKISLLADLESQKIYFIQKERESQKFQEMEEKIKNYNLILPNLESFYQSQIDLTSILEKISKAVPPGAYLTNLNFDSKTSQFFLNGFSPNREILFQFKENLEKTEGLKEIDFPAQNWVQLTNINFSVNFKIK